jgi:hypothetical protein
MPKHCTSAIPVKNPANIPIVPIDNPKRTGQQTFRMPPDLIAEIKAAANKTGMTASDIHILCLKGIFSMSRQPGREEVPWIVVILQMAEQHYAQPRRVPSRRNPKNPTPRSNRAVQNSDSKAKIKTSERK